MYVRGNHVLPIKKILLPALVPFAALLWILIPLSSAAEEKDADRSAKEALCDVYDRDGRLKLTGQETYPYDGTESMAGTGLYSQYAEASKSYEEEEIAKFCHAYFDSKNRLLYVLGYSSGILGGKSSYCEERIYSRDDAENTCRYLYYKSNSSPYKDGYYIAHRYLFETCDYQFDGAGGLVSCLSYRRNVGSDPNGYSEELFFSRGYQAEYDKERLMAELQYYDYWGTNEVGTWTYRIYQYNEQGDCALQVSVTEDEILLYCFEYQEDTNRLDVYTYQVVEDFELSCEDGSTYYLCPEWGKTAVKKTAADGSVEKELFYGKAMDMGQRHYLMPEEVEETSDDHIYVVKEGDCLWDIAKRCYKNGTYYELIYRMNQSVIGGDENLLLPGMRLYTPEAGNAQDTKVEQ